ncbi:site-specific DNA-methyltransferase [Burkholderia ubonensis]|uniref:site-specific DNA-methyltransferase n=1 Tax=Burkholderia ubonensis TaxID=101571 RepID=UPI002ABDCE8C|nr:site-specific DNA-methyltransferase [Burkholderia ubonensis]
MEYDNLTKEALIAILKRRDARAQYGLHWERSDIDADKALNRDFVGLEFEKALSCGTAPHRNFIIEGDNFDALRHLATTHAGAFHLIYIDVPYNTGRRDFVYNDHYFDATNRYRHSTWLEFMYQRLVLAKSLLREDGAIFVSIDDNELFNLGLLMNQVFGETRFVANCIWQKRYSRENREAIGDAHEYLLVYAPNPDKFKLRRGRISLSEEQARVYKNPDNPNETDPKKRWQSISMTAQGYRPNQMYAIEAPNGKVHYPPEGRCWSTIESEYLKLRAQGRIVFGKDGNGVPRMVRYLSDVEGLVPWTWWPHEEVGHTDEARKEIQDIFGTQTAFDTPKPVRLMERVLQIGAPEKDALILDFFAGSGTTAQAVLKMNKEDGGARRFVLVSSREATVEEPEKNLCRDVCARRVRAVVEGYRSTKNGEMPGLGGEFAYLRAKTVAMHRLEEGLTDEMVWNFALMACDHPITAPNFPLATSVNENHLIAYCANTRSATLEKLVSAVSAFEGKVVVLTWTTPAVVAALADLAERVSIVAVPDDLRRIFKQGTVRVPEYQDEFEVSE